MVPGQAPRCAVSVTSHSAVDPMYQAWLQPSDALPDGTPLRRLAVLSGKTLQGLSGKMGQMMRRRAGETLKALKALYILFFLIKLKTLEAI